uniref:Uncharacterized protein n=1 Tax=Myoviridae sp. ctWiL39 TaxID=2825120 RepID=A0A8S5PY00_9CAUD|nr:MAG TPA: hypothetical protein [Myoviridae sp. ctWiL39]DAW30444.1 MAG TPA: hypothetical protein [Bacteriophage sp.]DAW46121.1 MAG TPA: hypothetical protein [Caudoviricetes sp.]
MIITVSGFEEARNYPVMFGSSELLMDNNRDVFYVKSVDALGKQMVSSYKFEKIENDSPENYVSKQQFDELAGKIDALIANLGGMSNG